MTNCWDLLLNAGQGTQRYWMINQDNLYVNTPDYVYPLIVSMLDGIPNNVDNGNDDYQGKLSYGVHNYY